MTERRIVERMWDRIDARILELVRSETPTLVPGTVVGLDKRAALVTLEGNAVPSPGILYGQELTVGVGDRVLVEIGPLRGRRRIVSVMARANSLSLQPLDLYIGPFPPWIANASNLTAIGANVAHCARFQVFRDETVSTVYFGQGGVSAGNIDIGYYDDTGPNGVPGARLASTSPFACPAINTINASRALTNLLSGASLTFRAGRFYWLAWSASDATATFRGYAAAMSAFGAVNLQFGTIAGQHPLPANLSTALSSNAKVVPIFAA